MAPRDCARGLEGHRTKVRVLGEGFLSPPYMVVCECGWESDEFHNVLASTTYERNHLEDLGLIEPPASRPGLKIRRHRPRPEDVPTDRTGPDRPGSTYDPRKR